MRSSISGILAKLKIRILEEKIKAKFKDKIQHWFRYVDDIFVIVQNETDEDALLEEINSLDQKHSIYNRKRNR